MQVLVNASPPSGATSRGEAITSGDLFLQTITTAISSPSSKNVL